MTLAVGPVAVISLMTMTISPIATPGSPAVSKPILLSLLSAPSSWDLGLLAQVSCNPLAPVIWLYQRLSDLIAVSQFKHILGIPVYGHDMPSILLNLTTHLNETNLPTLVIGVSSMLFLFWVRSELESLLIEIGMTAAVAGAVTKAGPVMAAVVSTIVSFFALHQAGVSIVGIIPNGLPVPRTQA